MNLDALRARFWQKVDRTGECWVWTGYIDKKGYGRFSVGSTTLYAHRVSFALFVGRLGPEDLVLHGCDNRPCIRPSHLERGDYSDNLIDCWIKGRRPIPLWLIQGNAERKERRALNVQHERRRK